MLPVAVRGDDALKGVVLQMLQNQQLYRFDAAPSHWNRHLRRYVRISCPDAETKMLAVLHPRFRRCSAAADLEV